MISLFLSYAEGENFWIVFIDALNCWSQKRNFLIEFYFIFLFRGFLPFGIIMP